MVPVLIPSLTPTMKSSRCIKISYQIKVIPHCRKISCEKLHNGMCRPRTQFVEGIWKQRFHSENASSVFGPHYVGGIWKRNNHHSFCICVSKKLWQGSIMIIVMDQSIPAVPIPPGSPPGSPPSISTFLRQGQISGMGIQKLSKCPWVGTKKEGKYPASWIVAFQHLYSFFY